MTRFPELLRLLVDGGVEFIVVGGVAGAAHGAARATYDLDVVYRRTLPNLQRLVKTLAPQAPYLRGAPPGLPFHFDEETVKRGLNFTLTTRLGDLDLLGEIAGGGRYEDLEPFSQSMDLYGTMALCLDLPRLIQTKRAAGRPKDLEAISELEALQEEIRKGDSPTS